MRFHKQSKVHIPGQQRGNCLATALACIFDLEIDDIPQFENLMDKPGDEWLKAYTDWLLERGLEIATSKEPPEGYALAIGKSPRAINHCVVALNGELIHDPHPDNSFLVAVNFYEFFVEAE